MVRRCYRRVNGNLRTMLESNEMARREIPNRIAKASIKAFEVSVVIFARKFKEKNTISQLDQIAMKLDRSTRNDSETYIPMPAVVHQIGNRFR